MLKIEMINAMLDDDEDDVACDGDGDASPDESTQDIEWAVFNQHNQLSRPDHV